MLYVYFKCGVMKYAWCHNSTVGHLAQNAVQTVTLLLCKASLARAIDASEPATLCPGPSTLKVVQAGADGRFGSASVVNLLFPPELLAPGDDLQVDLEVQFCQNLLKSIWAVSIGAAIVVPTRHVVGAGAGVVELRKAPVHRVEKRNLPERPVVSHGYSGLP